jgi:hypothetical protein
VNDRDLLRACAIARRGDCPDVMQDIEELPAEIESDARYTRSLEKRAQWQPIETAPKDRALILCFCQRLGLVLARYDPDRSHQSEKERILDFSLWCADWNGDYLATAPTHWMPLPEPPK